MILTKFTLLLITDEDYLFNLFDFLTLLFLMIYKFSLFIYQNFICNSPFFSSQHETRMQHSLCWSISNISMFELMIWQISQSSGKRRQIILVNNTKVYMIYILKSTQKKLVILFVSLGYLSYLCFANWLNTILSSGCAHQILQSFMFVS